LMAAGEVLAVIGGALDRVEPDRSGLADVERLELVALAGVVAGRVEALRCALVAEADAAQASMRARGTPSSSWLALSGRLSRKESAGLLYRARDVAADPQVQREALAGRVSVEQARSISRVLRELPETLSGAQREQAAGALVGLAGRVDAAGLAGMGTEVLREVAPELAVQAEGERLARQAEKARRERSLWFVRDPGSIRFRGSLPVADAEGWVAIIDAHVESRRRNAKEARDPLAESPTPEQRRADALVAMIRDHSDRRLAPSGGGDRPRIVVTMDYDALVSGAVGSGLLASGQRIGAGEVRRLCCDADLVPVVLGSRSEVLDVGRVRRLVTRGVRIALTQRDGGCVFPACDTHPTACEAHHIVPWWAGGPTSLSNLVLLCHHHHSLVEPDRYGQRDQWAVRIGSDGVPECLPPRRLDPDRGPLRHQRLEGRGDPGGGRPPHEQPPPLPVPQRQREPRPLREGESRPQGQAESRPVRQAEPPALRQWEPPPL